MILWSRSAFNSFFSSSIVSIIPDDIDVAGATNSFIITIHTMHIDVDNGSIDSRLVVRLNCMNAVSKVIGRGMKNRIDK